MQSMMISVVLLLTLQFPSVLTKPTAFVDLKARALNNITADAAALTTNLGTLVPPWGPPKFSVNIEKVTVSIRSKDIYATVINLMHDLLHEDDFKSPLPDLHMDYRRENIAIIIQTIYQDNPIPRSFVVWAIARLMNDMGADLGYKACTVHLLWGTRPVGTMTILSTSRQNSNLQYGNLILSQYDTNQTSINATNGVGNGASWNFYPHGQLLNPRAIPMATIGAISAAAQEADHMFEHFVGSFLEYPAFHAYYAYPPLMLNKSILIKTMGAAAIWALDHDDFHELQVEVILGDRMIADGGVIGPMIGPGLLDFKNVTVS